MSNRKTDDCSLCGLRLHEARVVAHSADPKELNGKWHGECFNVVVAAKSAEQASEFARMTRGQK